MIGSEEKSEMYSKAPFIAGVMVALLIFFSLDPSPAIASTRMQVTFAISSESVDAGTSFTVTYGVRNSSATARVYLQRQFGTAKVWKSVKRLSGAEGTVAAPDVPIGKYEYRVYVIEGRTIATSPIKLLYSYGEVPFETVCQNPLLTKSSDCNIGTEQVGTTIFSYAGGFFGGYYPTYDLALSAKTTTCRSVTLQFAQRTSDGSYDTYVQFIQSATDPEAMTTGPNTIGVITATLDGGPWILNVAGDDGPDDVKLNGTFDCYSTTGF
jgi:hypothetical protein